jgi:hypothetical protein
MEFNGYTVPEEILQIIMLELVSLPPEHSSDPAHMVSVYNTLRAVRLVCKTFACTAAVHLFKNIPFSTDPADWVRITAVSKSPLLAPCVQRVNYRTWIYPDAYDNVRDYSYGLLSRQKPSGETSSGPLELGSPLLTDGSVQQGFQRYKQKYEHQQRLLSQESVDLDASDLKVLVHAFIRFPNLKEFSVSNPKFHVSQIETWRGPMYIGRTGKFEQPPRWIIGSSPNGGVGSADLLPLFDPSRTYTASRFASSWAEDDWGSVESLENLGAGYDGFALAKYRGLQLFALAAEKTRKKPQFLSVSFSEGAPLALSPTATTSSGLSLAPLLQSRSALSSLLEFEFEMVCGVEQDAEFLRSGLLGTAMAAAHQLQIIRVRNRYQIGANFTFGAMSSQRPSMPGNGWKLPLDSIFGASTFKKLRLLQIDGIGSTKTDLLNLLSRHKETLESFLVAGIGDFYDDDDVVEIPPGQQSWSNCMDVLERIGNLGLSLKRLVLLPGLQEERLDERLIGGEQWSSQSQANLGARYIYGVEEIQEFFRSNHV